MEWDEMKPRLVEELERLYRNKPDNTIKVLLGRAGVDYSDMPSNNSYKLIWDYGITEAKEQNVILPLLGIILNTYSTNKILLEAYNSLKQYSEAKSFYNPSLGNDGKSNDNDTAKIDLIEDEGESKTPESDNPQNGDSEELDNTVKTSTIENRNPENVRKSYSTKDTKINPTEDEAVFGPILPSAPIDEKAGKVDINTRLFIAILVATLAASGFIYNAKFEIWLSGFGIAILSILALINIYCTYLLFSRKKV